jgi:amino acid adenylation domain-containing protein
MESLLKELKENNISIFLDNKNLKLKFNGEKVPDQLLEKVKQNKGKLIQYLEDQGRIGEDSEIYPIPESESYVLSSAQRRIMVLSQLDENNTVYNLSGVYIFEGDVDVDSMNYAFDSLLDRHESLRTIFKENDYGEVRQFVLPRIETGFSVAFVDLRDHEDRDNEVKELVRQECLRPFDLRTGPLLRIILYRVAEKVWTFLYVAHHVIGDAWSMEVMVKEMFQFYNSHRRGIPVSLPPLRIQYKDYAAWQQDQLNTPLLKEHENYWLRQLEGLLPILQLPGDRPRPALKTYDGGAIHGRIDTYLLRDFKTLVHESGCTLFMGLLAAVDTLLYRYTDQEDIIVGTPIAGRSQGDLENQIGFYLNTLALRTRFSGEDSFIQLLEKVKRMTLEAFEHQVYPFDELVDKLNIRRDLSRSPIFDVLVQLQNTEVFNTKGEKAGLDDLKIEGSSDESIVVSPVDLTFYFKEWGDDLRTFTAYNGDIFDKESIRRMVGHFSNLLKSIVEQPSVPIKYLKYVDRREENDLLSAFNDTGKGLANKTVVRLFEEQAKRSPDETALVFEAGSMSYGELEAKANQLSYCLSAKYGILPGDMVGIRLPRSEWMIVSILGILKAGGAYLPIDTQYPPERVSHILANSRCRLLIDEETLEKIKAEIQDYNREARDAGPGPADMAYVLYTSGSSGMPKGCMISHGALSNYIQWASGYYFDRTEKTNFGLYTSLSFDLTITSLFCTLTTGGRLTIYRQDEDLAEILRHSFSEDSGINNIKLTPSHINILKHLFIKSSTMKVAITGGEQVTPEQVRILKRINPEMKVYNEYGPTEATVGCVVGELQPASPIHIGKPISNVRIYIVDDSMQLCPIGVYGEICISGAGLAAGYLNDAEQTAAKFVSNPYEGGKKTYKTGDIGRWRPDGTIEYLRRKDDQVKIRGYRIEPGEIESTLQGHPDIEAAAIIVKADQEGEKSLFTFISAKKELSPSEIRQYLNQKLPLYMVPEHFVFLDAMPLTPNGKIDRNKLLESTAVEKVNTAQYAPPRNRIEQQLVVIWQEVLGVDKIGMRDNFFDLGGNSIKVMKMVFLINRDLNTRISATLIFKSPNIRALASFLSEGDKNEDADDQREEERATANVLEETLKAIRQ